MADLPGIQFLKRAAVIDQGTWFSIHHRIVIDDKRPPIFPGNAHNTIRTAFRDATFWAHQGHCVYLAQGTYLTHGEHRTGPYPIANRHDNNLAGCKNLYMDIDVKPGAYASTMDAMQACHNFLKTTAIPEPTIIVASGTGGLHLYWTLDEIFDKKEFRRMATQLVAAAHECKMHFDQNCTSDPTRLLRVPGTWNFKGCDEGQPGKLVELLYDSTVDLQLQRMRDALAPFKSNSQSNRLLPSHRPNDGENYDADDLMGGVGDYPPISIDRVAEFCPFIRHTLDTGGADLVGEPQWHIVASLACHTDDPLPTFHRLCEKNQYYVKEDANEKLATTQQQHQRDGVGPHKCEAIKRERAECATCPYLHLGTSPISVPHKRLNGATYFSPIVNPNHPDLPEPYFRGPDQLIYFPQADDGTEGGGAPLCVFPFPIIPHSGFLETGKPYKLSFETMQGNNIIITKTFEAGSLSEKNSMTRTLSNEGMNITKNTEQARVFLMSYQNLLRSQSQTLVEVPPFGWSPDSKSNLGFAYNGTFISPNGSFKCKRPLPGEQDFQVMGDTQIWKDLASLVITPDRPDLAILVAAAFAAPLVIASGEDGFILGVWSSQSGIGKTAAIKLGHAVWGKPIISGLGDTVNYTFAKAAELRHLPLYHDEIKERDQIQNFCKIIFTLTGGHERGRSDRSGNARPIRDFQTLCCYAANVSMVAAVKDHHQGTNASTLRIFEMLGIALPDKDEKFKTEVGDLLTSLKFNYGGIGQQYAAFLGANKDEVWAELSDMRRKLRDQLKHEQDERFWMVAIATIMLGAKYAGKIGAFDFPMREMFEYMMRAWARQRKDLLIASSDFSNAVALSNVIGNFIHEKLTRNTIILNRTWKGRGRPPKNFADVLNEPRNDINWGPIEVQISGDPLTLRVSDHALKLWCEDRNIPKPSLCHAMREILGATLNVRGMASGSYRESPRINAWDINPKGTALEQILDFVFKYDKFLP